MEVLKNKKEQIRLDNTMDMKDVTRGGGLGHWTA